MAGTLDIIHATGPPCSARQSKDACLAPVRGCAVLGSGNATHRLSFVSNLHAGDLDHRWDLELQVSSLHTGDLRLIHDRFPIPVVAFAGVIGCGLSGCVFRMGTGLESRMMLS